MIETPEFKIAENSEEAFWKELKSKSLKGIESLKREIIINEAVVELADKKMIEVQQNGK